MYSLFEVTKRERIYEKLERFFLRFLCSYQMTKEDFGKSIYLQISNAFLYYSNPKSACSKSTMKIRENWMKNVQVNNRDTRTTSLTLSTLSVYNVNLQCLLTTKSHTCLTKPPVFSYRFVQVFVTFQWIPGTKALPTTCYPATKDPATCYPATKKMCRVNSQKCRIYGISLQSPKDILLH